MATRYHLNNNQIIIHNAQLAQNYTAEFDKMFEKHTFGPNKAPGVPNPVVTIEGTRIENYFASEDDTIGNIVRTVERREAEHLLPRLLIHAG